MYRTIAGRSTHHDIKTYFRSRSINGAVYEINVVPDDTSNNTQPTPTTIEIVNDIMEQRPIQNNQNANAEAAPQQLEKPADAVDMDTNEEVNNNTTEGQASGTNSSFLETFNKTVEREKVSHIDYEEAPRRRREQNSERQSRNRERQVNQKRRTPATENSPVKTTELQRAYKEMQQQAYMDEHKDKEVNLLTPTDAAAQPSSTRKTRSSQKKKDDKNSPEEQSSISLSPQNLEEVLQSLPHGEKPQGNGTANSSNAQ